MVLYCVYRAIYTTRRGTRRAYIGYSGNVDVRTYWHKVRPPSWMKPKRNDTLHLVILEAGIQSVGLARAAEAMYSEMCNFELSPGVRGGSANFPRPDSGGIVVQSGVALSGKRKELRK